MESKNVKGGGGEMEEEGRWMRSGQEGGGDEVVDGSEEGDGS